MTVYQTPEGSLVVPRLAMGEQGLIGDGTEIVDPGTPEHRRWSDWLDRVGQKPLPMPAAEEGDEQLGDKPAE